MSFPFTADEADSTVRFRVHFKFMHERFGPNKKLKEGTLVSPTCVGGDGGLSVDIAGS